MRNCPKVGSAGSILLLLLGASSAARAETPDATDARAHMLAHLGAETRWIKLADLVTRTHQSCVDGRSEKGVVGTPGGDAGELVLALTVIERMRGAPLTAAEIDAIIQTELEAFGHLYLHTDDHALDGLRRVLAEDPTTRGYAERMAEEGGLPIPRGVERARVLEALLRPEHVGCGHMRLLLQHPGSYQVRPEVPRQVLAAIYQRWFDETPGTRIMALDGEHEETAVLVVRVRGPLEPYTKVPLVVPRHEAEQIFVSHPDVNRYLRRLEVSLLFERHRDLLPEDATEPRFQAALDQLAGRHADETLGRLAGGLPLYVLEVFGDSCALRVQDDAPGI